MYTDKDLTRYEYFSELDVEYVLDSLTGVVSRGYIVGFAKYLIEKNVPFVFAILDVDNFKLINDNYGHSTGDECLKMLAENMVRIAGENGVVGRYGGDEFVYIGLNPDPTYDNVYKTIASFYGYHEAVRRSYAINKVQTFLTGTFGSASYPYDATDYDDLFSKADKALYRGKTKGRNCFIVYVDSMHKNIDVCRKENSYFPDMMAGLTYIYKIAGDSYAKIQNLASYLRKTLNASEVLFQFSNLKLVKGSTTEYSTLKKSLYDDLDLIFEDNHKDYVLRNEMPSLKRKSPAINRFLTEYSSSAIMIFKLRDLDGKVIGYLTAIDSNISRLWQEREVSLAYYIANLAVMLQNVEK